MFWFVVSLIGCIGAFLLSVYWWKESGPLVDVAIGFAALLFSAAWATVYWRLRRAK
jgi:hypothetical protein